MKKLLVVASVLALALSVGLMPAFAQKGKHARAVSSKMATTKGAPKYGMPTIPDKAGKPAPPQKGGAKAKGKAAVGVVHVDNRTGYNIYVYVDGSFRAPLGAYGDVYFYSSSGMREMYAVSAGGTASWGPRDLYVEDGDTSTWTLND